VLETLPPAEFRAGMAEVIKHGIIDAPDLFAALEKSDYELSWLLAEAIGVKVRVVQADPFEQGRRAVLNLGHTFGHALEVLSDYSLTHGMAVGIGLVAAARLSARMGTCDDDLAPRIEQLLRRLGLPATYHGHTPQQVWQAMATDKKRRGKTLRFVLPRAVGDVFVTGDVRQADVLDVLTALQED
jgi:3-dehydroquinate synthetase